MDCSDINEKLSAYIDNELSAEERAAVGKHIKTCSRCGPAFEELKKTIAHTRNIEEVEPPPWLTNKIMAQVREEAGQEKGIVRKLFYPLRIKIPIQAAATLAVCVFAFIVFKSIEPVVKYTEMPQEEELIVQQEHDEEVPADDMYSAMPAKRLEGRITPPEPVTEYEVSSPDTSDLSDQKLRERMMADRPHAEAPSAGRIKKKTYPESKETGIAGIPAPPSSPGDIGSLEFMDTEDKRETFQAEIVEISDTGKAFVSYEVLFRRSDSEELFCDEVRQGHPLFQLISGAREKLKSGQQKLDSLGSKQIARALDLPKLRITAAKPYLGGCSFYNVSRDVIEWSTVDNQPRKD
jgi:hypothetical protein